MLDLNCIESALSCTGWNRARVEFLARFVVSLLTAQTVCLTRLAVLFPSEAATDSCYKRMQRFLRGFELDYSALARLLVQIAGVATPWTLALDRTNWKLGKAELNILMLCIVHRGVAFPVLWTALAKEDGRGKAGNSNAAERIALLERFVETFGQKPIRFLCADREFVGRDWLRLLQENVVSFRLRLKGDVLVAKGRGEMVCADWLFRNCPIQREQNLGQRLILGYRLFISGTRLIDGHFLIVISYQAFCLSDYALRWSIETMFAAFKSRGFRLEDTHITCPERLSRLLRLLAIAYCWAFAVGKWLAETKPLQVKKHGRAPMSLVRRGLDYLRPVAVYLCTTIRKCNVKQAVGFLFCTLTLAEKAVCVYLRASVGKKFVKQANNMKTYRYRRFATVASIIVRIIAHPNAFLLSLLVVVAWVVSGLFSHYNPDWQTVTYSVSSLITFLLIFLLQHTQSREMAAVQLKLNELIRASEGTHNALLDIEHLTDRDYDQIRENYSLLAKQAREQLKAGKLQWATARIQMESLDSLLDPGAINTDAAIREPERIDSLHAAGLSDGAMDLIFDRLTRVAAKAIDVPVVLITLVEADRQWFVSQVGLAEPYCSLRQTPLSHSFCKHVVALKKPLIISDARAQPLVENNPAITALGVIAYAGIPLLGAGNHVLGSFCAIDHKPRNWTESEISILQDLAEVAMQEIQRQTIERPARADDLLSVSSLPLPSPNVSAADDNAPISGGATILIVDDSATNRKLLSHRLEKEGYSVVISATGQEALDYLQTTGVDLVLLDIMLPDMDGETVLQTLKSDATLKTIPVVMISALDEKDSIRRCLNLGARDYLLKPCNPQTLQTCIRTHIAATKLPPPLLAESVK